MSDGLKGGLKFFLVTAPINIPVGIVVVFLLMALFMGSINDAFVLLVISIICTLGISLLIWLPVWYGVGYLLVAFFRILFSGIMGKEIYPAALAKQNVVLQAASSSSAEEQRIAGLSRDEQAVVNYIKKAQAKGLNQEFITKALQANGWTPESIRTGFQFVEKESS